MALRVAAISFVPFGSDERAYRIVEALASRGDRVSVFSPGNVAPPNGVQVHPVGGELTSSLASLRFLGETNARLIAAHMKEPFDLLLVQAPADLRLLAAMIPRILGPKLLLDLGAAETKAVRPLSLLADAVLASSLEQYDQLLKAGVPTYSLHLVTNFLNPKLFSPREKDPRIEKGAQVKVVTHASLGADAIRAAEKAIEAAQAIDPRFVFEVLDGSEAARAEALKSANLSLCLPPSPQAIPQAMFESLAIAVPTIATASPLLDSEATAPANTPEEAGALLVKLAKEPKSREKLATAAKAWHEAHGAPKQSELIYRVADFLCLEKVLAEKRARQAASEGVKTGSKKTPPKSAS